MIDRSLLALFARVLAPPLLLVLFAPACALSTQPDPPALEPVELDLFGSWRSTERGLEPLDGDAVAWISDGGPCRLDVALYASASRGEGDRWGVVVFDGLGAVAHADDAGAAGPIVIEVDGGSRDGCTAVVLAPTRPNGDALIDVQAAR
jgi:hypothetical protein